MNGGSDAWLWFGRNSKLSIKFLPDTAYTTLKLIKFKAPPPGEASWGHRWIIGAVTFTRSLGSPTSKPKTEVEIWHLGKNRTGSPTLHQLGKSETEGLAWSPERVLLCGLGNESCLEFLRTNQCTWQFSLEAISIWEKASFFFFFFANTWILQHK